MSSLFIDYVHEKGDICFNPELSPIFDDEQEIFSPSNGFLDEVHLDPTQKAAGAHMREHSMSSPSPNGNGNTYSIPLFNGIDSREFVSWLYAIECCFGVNDFSEHEKCDMVVSYLRNDALKWYHGIAYAKARNGAFKFKYWHKLKSSLKEMYLNKAVMNDLENEFKNLKMDSLCVKDYAMMFNELYFICGNPNDSSKKINLFYNGLNSEIQTWINIEQISSFELLCELALYSEYLIHEHEIYMESLAKADVKHAIFMSCGKGFGCGVPVTCGIPLSDKLNVLMSVLGTVIVQGAIMLGHESDLNGIRWSDLCLGSQDTKDHAYEGVNGPFFNLKSFQKVLNVNGVTLGDDLRLAYAQLSEFSPEFPWECWPPKDVVEEEQEAELGACSSIYSSPLELSINQKLQQPLRLKIDKFLSSFNVGTCCGSSKGELITCALLTHHFHYYMLLRLKIALVHLDAISYILEVGNSEIDQLSPYCSVLKIQFWWIVVAQNCCVNWIKLSGISSTNSLRKFEGVSVQLVMFVVRLAYNNYSSPLSVLSGSSSPENSHLSLNFNVRLLQQKPLCLLMNIMHLGLGACMHLLENGYYEVCTNKRNEKAICTIYDPGGISSSHS